MGGGLESRCVGRVYGADGEMRSFGLSLCEDAVTNSGHTVPHDCMTVNTEPNGVLHSHDKAHF